jgi:hypothetical protein
VLGLLIATAPQPALAKKKRDSAAQPPQSRRKSLAQVVEGTERLAGLLDFHRSADKLYLELPADLLDAPLGFAAIRVGPAGDFVMRGGTVDSQLVRWQRAGDHLVLRKENLDFRAAPGSPESGVVEASFLDSPVFAGKLIPLSDEPAPLLIDASKLFGPDLARVLGPQAGFSVRDDEAVLVSLKTFEDNVVARVAYRVRRKDGPPGGGGGDGSNPFSRFLRPGRIPDSRMTEVVVDYNFFRLPDDGFRPRYEDERIGGFSRPVKDYTGMDSKDTLFRHLLSRWDVREPIVFTMDPSVPEKWRPLVREGAEWWNTAFAKIGVDDAVRVLDPPAEGEWDPADIRHSVIYWNIADDLVFSGAAGPSLVDPRTGKVLKANVWLNGEFFSFALNRYLVYAWWRAPEPGGAGETLQARRELREALRAQEGMCDLAASFSSQIAFARLVLQARGVLRSSPEEADRFAREAFLELVAHEVGHALGFPHNWKASLVASWEDVRDGKVSGRVDGNIFSSSVMDYNPIYLAPAGSPQGDYFMKELGPFDDLFVEHIYRPLDDLSPAEQARRLDAIAARAETEHGLIYDSGELGAIDPTSNSDDFGDDPLRFAESRLRMIHEEVLPRLDELVLGEGHDYNLLRQALDSAIFSVAMDYIDMTARHVGGQVLLRRVAGSPAAEPDGPDPITPVSVDQQREALDVLERWLFAEGRWDLPPELLARLKADLQFDWNYPWRYASDYHVGNRIAGLYEAALGTLLQPARLARILDNERRLAEGVDRFTIPELLGRLEEIAFAGVDDGSIGADRRALQRMLARHLGDLVLEPGQGTPAEASQVAAMTLRSIRGRAERALEAREPLDGYTVAHLQDLVARATRVLEASLSLPTAR